MPALNRTAINAKTISLISGLAIAFGVFLSGFVFREPAPYELYMAGLMGLWFLFGLRLSSTVMPLLVLSMVFVLGGMISLTQARVYQDGPLYIAVTAFLALSAVFFAAVIEADHRRLHTIMVAYVAAACMSALLGIAAYFGAFGDIDYFVRYDRAAGGFEDPNVFGPFLALPAIYLLHQIMTGPARRILVLSIPFGIIIVGLLLSFSRGAWGLILFGVIALMAILLVTRTSNRIRIRIVVMSLIAMALMAVTVIAALQIPQVAELFETRARLTHEYDTGQFGRFARHGLGLIMAMENPLGIGPLEFGPIFGEDTHNIWLKALLDYSWLGFAAYAILIVMTMAVGFRQILRERPWQAVYICAYVALAGHVLLGMVIDTDHWRHFFMLLGIVWGCIALEARHGRQYDSGRHIQA